MNPEGLYFTCPACGEDVPRAAKSCPECGACEKSGWSEDARYDGLQLPDESEFDYDKFTAEEFGGVPKKSSREWFVWVVAVLLLAALVWSTLGRW